MVIVINLCVYKVVIRVQKHVYRTYITYNLAYLGYVGDFRTVLKPQKGGRTWIWDVAHVPETLLLAGQQRQTKEIPTFVERQILILFPPKLILPRIFAPHDFHEILLPRLNVMEEEKRI